MSNALVRFLVILALVAQGPVVNLGVGSDDEPRLPTTSTILGAWIESPPATNACVRSDDPDDDDSAELDESGAACLAPCSAAATTPIPAIKAPLPIPDALPASQDSPGPTPSRAPPLL